MMKLMVVTILFASITNTLSASNLTCYQCSRTTEGECGIEDLKPCAAIHDRCAIYLTKNSRDGFSVKRVCGLAPCGFDDIMAEKGLGMNCDRSTDEYSCTYCCRGNGCNKNNANDKNKAVIGILLASWVSIVLLTLYGAILK